MSKATSYQPLHLACRPQTLNDLVGQEAVKRTLANAITYGRLSHAYLFTGPRGTGKTSTARILAKSLNCRSGPKVTPCLECTACQEIKEGKSPAVLEIDAASNNSVDDARILIERAPLVAVGGRYKLYIIDECHMLTREAFNALLKTIEEPPPNVVFVLATTEEHKVPATIVSRCQKLMFRLVSQQDLVPYLAAVAKRHEILIENSALEMIARRCGGGLRDALSLLDQASLLSVEGKSVTISDLMTLIGALDEDVLLEMSACILEGNGQRLLEAADNVLKAGREPAVLTSELARHFLNLIKASYVVSSPTMAVESPATVVLGTGEYVDKVFQQAKGVSAGELSAILEHLNRLDQVLRRSTQPVLQLQISLVSICHRQDLHLLSDFEQRLRRLESSLGLAGAKASLRAVAGHLGPPPPTPPGQASQAAPDSYAKVPAGQAGDQSQAKTGKVQAEGDQAGDGPLVPLSNSDLPDKKVSALDLSSAATSEVEAELPKGDATLSFKQAPEKSRQEGGGDEQDRAELDERWSHFLDELHKRHIPTYSIANTYAFPLALTEKELTVGVRSENWQKMLENKFDHLQVASEVAFGKAINLRVKVVAESQARPVKPSSRKPSVRLPAEGDEGDDKEAEPMPAAPRENESACAGKKDAATGDGERPVRQGDGVSEAYKLFEGPGSRLIL